MVEQVLVFPAEVLAPYASALSGRIAVGEEFSKEILGKALAQASFMDRPAAEKDPNFKQLIPYCVLWTEENGKRYVFAYQRTKKGGENRLHDKWSVGVGGHINPCDDHDSAFALNGVGELAYYWGLTRELSEEVSVLRKSLPPSPLAVIYDPSDDVGKVHFGVVHVVRVDPGEVKSADPALAGGQFFGRLSLGTMAVEGKFENWSRLVAENVQLWG